MTIKEKTIKLIDELKSTCATYGMGNDGNEYKIITQVFLYKFLNDKFGYELKNAKSDEEYIKDLKSELTTFKDNDYSIANMYTSSSTDVEEFNMDGYEVARLYGTFNVRTKDGTKILQEVFILRKEQSTGHWKVYGFAPVTDDESAE